MADCGGKRRHHVKESFEPSCDDTYHLRAADKLRRVKLFIQGRSEQGRQRQQRTVYAQQRAEVPRLRRAFADAVKEGQTQ